MSSNQTQPASILLQIGQFLLFFRHFLSFFENNFLSPISFADTGMLPSLGNVHQSSVTSVPQAVSVLYHVKSYKKWILLFRAMCTKNFFVRSEDEDWETKILKSKSTSVSKLSA